MTIHCVPVADSERSFCRSGMARVTIVWSMNIIATAKIIATSTSRGLPAADVPEFIGLPSPWFAWCAAQQNMSR